MLCNFRDELDAAEYDETKDDTIEQLKELNKSLHKLANGDISLISTLGAVQMVQLTMLFIKNSTIENLCCRRHKQQYHKPFIRLKLSNYLVDKSRKN